MERIFKSTSEELYKKIRVVIGIQEIREYTVVSETVYEAISPNMPINHLILSIHIAQVQFEDKDDTLVYYKNCYGHNIAVMNADMAKFRKNIAGTVISNIKNIKPNPAQTCQLSIIILLFIYFIIFF